MSQIKNPKIKKELIEMSDQYGYRSHLMFWKGETNLNLDENYDCIEEAFKKWMGEPYGEFSLRGENIDKASLSFVRQAFFDGFEFGYKKRKDQNYNDWNQK